MKNRISQRQGIFYRLYQNRKINKEEFIPIWKFIGEIEIPELQMWSFVSYEVSARMSELWKMNPNLFERQAVQGKTGARYYAYRLALDCRPDMIIDPDIISFYNKLKGVVAL